MLLAAAPVYFIFLIRKFIKEIVKPETERNIDEEIGEMFEDYRETTHYSLFYPFIFFVRRYIILLVITTLPGYRMSQLITQFLSTGFVIYYLWRYMPYKNSTVDRQEIINESSVFIAAYCLVVFTEWVWDFER